MKITINAQAFHAAQQNAAVKDVRFALNGVYLAPNGDCVGTDGYTLAVTPNAGDFADIPHRLIKIKDAIPVNTLLIELDTESRVASFISIKGEIKRVGYEFEREKNSDTPTTPEPFRRILLRKKLSGWTLFTWRALQKCSAIPKASALSSVKNQTTLPY